MCRDRSEFKNRTEQNMRPRCERGRVVNVESAPMECDPSREPCRTGEPCSRLQCRGVYGVRPLTNCNTKELALVSQFSRGWSCAGVCLRVCFRVCVRVFVSWLVRVYTQASTTADRELRATAARSLVGVVSSVLARVEPRARRAEGTRDEAIRTKRCAARGGCALQRAHRPCHPPAWLSSQRRLHGHAKADCSLQPPSTAHPANSWRDAHHASKSWS